MGCDEESRCAESIHLMHQHVRTTRRCIISNDKTSCRKKKKKKVGKRKERATQMIRRGKDTGEWLQNDEGKRRNSQERPTNDRKEYADRTQRKIQAWDQDVCGRRNKFKKKNGGQRRRTRHTERKNRKKYSRLSKYDHGNIRGLGPRACKASRICAVFEPGAAHMSKTCNKQ